MAITVALPTNGTYTNSTDQADYTTNAVAFVANKLYVVGLVLARAAAVPDVPVLTSPTGGTWTAINGSAYNTVAANRSRVTTAYWRATATVSEAITVDCTNANTGIRLIVAEVAEAAATSPIVQSATSRGDAATSGSVTLNPFASAQNLSLGFFGCDLGAAPFSPGGGFTELSELSVESESLVCVYQVGDFDPSVTMAAADWGGVGMQVAAESGGFSVDMVTGARRIGWRRHRCAAW